MSTPPHIGLPDLAWRHVPACRSRRRTLQFGVSVLAIAASLAPVARAQTVIGPGTTVTNTTTTTGSYRLSGNGGTLINQGTIAPSANVPVEAQLARFTASQLTSYAISDVSLVNSGLITSPATNAVTAVGVDGFSITNGGSITNSATGFPALYLNNVNNLQLSNTGLIGVNSPAAQSRVANLYDVTNSTLVNQGTMAVMSVTDALPALFLSAKSANVTVTNGGTISTAGGGQAILVGGTSTASFTTTIDVTNVVTEEPVASNITLNNSGVLSSTTLALTVGGTASAVAVTNSGTITTTSATGANAITVQNAASQAGITNNNLIVNAGTGSAIDVSTSGAGVSIGNTGTITELGGNGIAIDHLNGTAPLEITNGGVINGSIRLSQPGDTFGITGGAINGAVIASNPGAGVVTFNAAGGFTTGGDFGSASNPLGGIVIAGGTLTNNNTLTADSVTVGPVARNVALNNAGVLASNNVALAVGGFSSVVAVTNSGTITTTSAAGADAIAVSGAASQVRIANSGLVLNAGAGSAIDVSTSGSGVNIGNTGTISEVAGNGIAIDHVNGSAPLAINNSGIINGNVRLSQPGDTLGITGGAINGSVVASNPGAGTVTFNVPGGFTTGGNYGTASNPLGAIVISGGGLTNGNTLASNGITVAGSTGQVAIVNVGLVLNAGTGAAIGVSTSGAGVTIGNSGTISEVAGNGIAIDHATGTTPLAINTSGVINGGVRLSQPGDTMLITGGSINGSVAASSPGAGTVTFNVPGGFTTGGDFGSAASPLSGIVIAAGTLNNANTLAATGVTVSATTDPVAVANSGLIVTTTPGSTVVNGIGSAIVVNTTGAGVTIGNTGTITQPTSGAIAIDHVDTGQPMAVSNSGTINGGIRFAQPGDTLNLTGGIINGPVVTRTAGAGSVTFNVPGGYSTAADFGTASLPLGAIVISGGGLTNTQNLVANGIAVSGSTGAVNIANFGLVLNTGTGAAIDVSTAGASATINNAGTITGLLGTGIAIDHVTGTQVLAIGNSGVINGGVQLSQPGDSLEIIGGTINGAVIASTPGAGTVSINALDGYTTGGDFGTASNPLGAIVIGGNLNNGNALVANTITLGPTGTLNNTGVVSSSNVALAIGGTSLGVGVNNSGTIMQTSAGGSNAIALSAAAGNIGIVNGGLISNAGTGAAIDVATTISGLPFGTGTVISNAGTISEVAGNGIAIDHANGAQPLAITNSGIINGAVRLSLSGDTLNITGGAINGAVVATTPGAGVVTFNAPGGFTTGGDMGTTANPLAAIVIAGGTLNNNNLLTANSITVVPTAGSVTLNNAGLFSSRNLALAIGGTSSSVTVNNTGAILTSAAGGMSAIVVGGGASQVNIGNAGLIENLGVASAIEVSTSGSGVTIGNTGTISEVSGNGIAIDHLNGTGPLAINTSGIINGGIRLSQPGDTLNITGGGINGAVTASNAGAGTVTFNAPGGFTTGGDFGSSGNPLGAILVAGGVLNLGNALWANSVTLGGGSTTTLLGNVNAVANNGTLNFAGGTLSLGTNTLVLGSNATVRTSTMDGSTINVTINGNQSGAINARAGNATIDTSANTLIIRPNLVGAIPAMGTQYAVIETSPGANVSKALTKVIVAPGPTAALFSVGTATSNDTQTPGMNIVLTVAGNSATVTNAAAAANNQQIDQAQVNAVVTGITERIGDAVADAIAGSIGSTKPGGISGGDEPGHDWTVWTDASGSYLSDTGTGRAFDGSIWTLLVGADQRVTDSIIVGAVAGGEGDQFKLSSAGGRRSSTGLSITPYAAYILTDWASVDLELSYARLDNRITVTAGQPIGSRYATNRVFAAGNFSAYWNIDDLTLRGKVGFLIANNGGPRYTDGTGVRSTPASTTLQEARLGGEATYHWGQFEPFLNMTLEYDLRGAGGLNTAVTGVSSPSRVGLQYDAGLRYKTEGGIQMGVQAGGETLRGTQSTLMAGLFARIPL